MFRALRYAIVTAAISIALPVMPGWAAGNASTVTPPSAQTSAELYAFDLPFIEVLDSARSLLMKNGDVGISEEHVIAGEDGTSHYRYVIAVTSAKSSSKKSCLSIVVSPGEQQPSHGAAAPRDESQAFVTQLGEKLGTVPTFVSAGK